MMQSVKSNSSKWINSNGLIKSKFHWQAGFGAFSCSEDGVDGLIKYIMNQEAHHSKKSFKEEFYEMLKEFNIEYDERFIFEFYNED